MNLKLNLACGNIFLPGNSWLNYDYGGDGNHVKKANLLAKIPLPNKSAELIYSSHFLEHIPHSLVPGFLSECFRLLSPNGVIRLVLPDLENMCRSYLTCRMDASHDKADFLVLELIDQCVRRIPGGELGSYYNAITEQSGLNLSMIDFVRERTGENLLAVASNRRRTWRNLFYRGIKLTESARISLAAALLPGAFRDQNVSFCNVGEKHHWIYDEYQLTRLLVAAGFESVQRMSASTSLYANFPFCPLDLDLDGKPRKGEESMYIEAVRPERLTP